MSYVVPSHLTASRLSHELFILAKYLRTEWKHFQVRLKPICPHGNLNVMNVCVSRLFRFRTVGHLICRAQGSFLDLIL